MYCKLPNPDIKFFNYWLCALLCISSVFIEPKGRIEELALWVLPRFFECFWNYLKKRNIVDNGIPGFITVMFALSVGLFCEAYNTNKSDIKSRYALLGEQILGNEQKIPDNSP